MIPKTYTQKGELTTFHYRYQDLRLFIKQGKEFGNVGFIIVKKDGDLITYKGFGTIENPSTSLTTMSLVHFPPFDGEFNPDAIVHPKLSTFSTRFIILDFSQKNNSI